MKNKINNSLEKEKLINNQWNNKNKLNYLIYYCINIENNIKDINIINENLKKYNEIQDSKILFNPKEDEMNKLIEYINNFGFIDFSTHNYRFKK